MRWLVLCVLLAGHTALAKRVVMDPPLVRACPGGKAWPAIAACVAKQGTVRVVRQTPTARLVRIEQVRDGKPYETTLALYVIRKGEWKLGGMWRSYATEFDVLGFEQVTVGKHTGHRIDLGQTQTFIAVVDDISPVPALLRMKHSLFCGGDYYGCTDVTTLCEVLVRGQARFVFRGSLSIKDDNMVVVSGDRTKVGPSCATSERAYLGWQQP